MRRATCWAPGCDSDLNVVDGWYACPKGCKLRDMRPWLRDHITYVSCSPAQLGRFFGDVL